MTQENTKELRTTLNVMSLEKLFQSLGMIDIQLFHLMKYLKDYQGQPGEPSRLEVTQLFAMAPELAESLRKVETYVIALGILTCGEDAARVAFEDYKEARKRATRTLEDAGLLQPKEETPETNEDPSLH